MTRPRATIVAAVIVDNGRVLMVRRRIAEDSLSWQFPAGEMEPNEAPFDTALRETREEVGLIVQPTSTIGERVHPATGRHIVYIDCTVEAGSVASLVDADELEAVEWCDWSTLEDYVPTGMYEPVRSHLRKALSL